MMAVDAQLQAGRAISGNHPVWLLGASCLALRIRWIAVWQVPHRRGPCAMSKDVEFLPPHHQPPLAAPGMIIGWVPPPPLLQAHPTSTACVCSTRRCQRTAGCCEHPSLPQTHCDSRVLSQLSTASASRGELSTSTPCLPEAKSATVPKRSVGYPRTPNSLHSFACATQSTCAIRSSGLLGGPLKRAATRS